MVVDISQFLVKILFRLIGLAGGAVYRAAALHAHANDSLHGLHIACELLSACNLSWLPHTVAPRLCLRLRPLSCEKEFSGRVT